MSLLTVVGETGSGKSSLVLEIAKRLNGEIINADSTTFRRGLDIGTAKPSPEEREQIRHHLIDIIEPTTVFTVYDYKRLVLETINKIEKRHKLPILVGGSGLYINSVIYDYNFVEHFNRQSLYQKLNGMSLKELQDMIITKGYDISKVDPLNSRRLVSFILNKGQITTRSKLLPGVVVIGLAIPRIQLQQRVIERVDTMLQNGLEDEVKQLKSKLGLAFNQINVIGYKEWDQYLIGKETKSEVRSKTINHTLQLAKKQATWFKQNNDIIWVNYNTQVDSIVELITTAFSN